jgi:glycosyltransferase involved in cell wall biosynthesis
MKILWHSAAPWILSGYGIQTDLFAPRVAALGHDVAISGYIGAHQLTGEWKGLTVYPAGTNNAIGMDVIGYHYEQHQADVCLALCDAWALSPKMMRLLNSACWMPVDQDPLSSMNVDFLRESGARPVAMARYGQRVLEQAGFPSAYVPHGVDCQLFAPRDDRDGCRAAAGLGPDTFVIGINAANRDVFRKGLPEQLCAFASFRKRHPDSKLILNMAYDHPKGLDLPTLLENLGIGEDTGAVRFPDQGAYAAGDISSADLAMAFYGTLDLLSSCSYAEGFGVAVLEAAACGVPSVVSEGSAQPEVGGPAAWVVKAQDFWVQAHQAWWHQPLISEIEAAYEAAWLERENGEAHARRAAARAHAEQYDADLVTVQFWKPFLDDLEASL